MSSKIGGFEGGPVYVIGATEGGGATAPTPAPPPPPTAGNIGWVSRGFDSRQRIRVLRINH